MFDSTVAKSILKTDHNCVYVNCLQPVKPITANCRVHDRRRVKCYNKSDAALDSLHKFLQSYNWNALLIGIDCGTLSADDAYNDLMLVLNYALDNVLGYKLITMREKDPPLTINCLPPP